MPENVRIWRKMSLRPSKHVRGLCRHIKVQTLNCSQIPTFLLGDILQGRETEFLQTLHRLEKQSHLSVPALEVEIDEIKTCVAEVSFLPFDWL